MDELVRQFEHELMSCSSCQDLETLKVKYLGKKGVISEKMASLRSVPPEDKPKMGQAINTCKKFIEEKIESFFSRFEEESWKKCIQDECLDVTLPGRHSNCGSKHPINATMEHIVGIFKELGFSVQVGPQIDSDYYNFDVLNFAEDHPAKDMQDTFYISPGVLLRTHTSTIQGRFMERNAPPISIICPGRVFRNETVSARSHVFFHQVEGLCVDETASLQDLFQTLQTFVQRLFKKELAIRFRPSYFPFVEPGVEVDVECLVCSGKGCPLCKKSGWLEILGAGMVHPQVLRNVGIDPEKYRGYAWGLGIERIVMLLNGIKDIRLFGENDLRFLKQFHYV